MCPGQQEHLPRYTRHPGSRFITSVIEGEQGPTIMLHVVNGLGAVSVDPSAKVSNQKCTVEGLPVNLCDMIHSLLRACEPGCRSRFEAGGMH